MKTYFRSADAWVDCKRVTLPNTIRGFTMMMDDGSYTILINRDLDAKAKDKTMKHELQHIKNRDFNKEEEARLIEEMLNYQNMVIDERGVQLEEA